MTRAAYFECFSGASGDMILGALVDAGWPEQALRDALAKIPLDGYTVTVREAQKGALFGTQVQITVTEPQPERDMEDILPIIEGSDLPDPVKANSKRLFWRLAEVEGLEHRQPPATVHFHEVGAVDSILDILGACAGLHDMGIAELYVSPINVGGGTTNSRDGILPVPGPATLELLKGRPIYASAYAGEFLTPTGALILSTLATDFGPMPPMRVECIGYGAGQRDFAIPNMLRVSIGELDQEPDQPGETADAAVMVETNIDDMNPEWLSYLADRLRADGALDVTMTPVLMKKGRPGTVLSVLTTPAAVQPALDRIFAETTTLGVRMYDVRRQKLRRRIETVTTPWGPVRVKVAQLGSADRNHAPEYEDCQRLASAANVPLRDVYDAARRAMEAGD